MAFVHRHAPDARPNADDFCLIIHADRLLARPEASQAADLPTYAEVSRWASGEAPLHVGMMDGRGCWLFGLDGAESPVREGWEWHDTRALLGVFTAAQSQAVSCARQLLWWDRRHRYCGVCGTPTTPMAEERARRCPRCSAQFFPSVSPAIIVAVTRGDEILLAHNRNFRPGMFSVLAGFVDPGETLEQAVVREIAEEVSLQVDELRYVSSQPWPFPNSLMLGFRARHAGGEIQVDGKEIEQAGWFRRGELPEIPRPGTVARQLIDAWARE